MRPLRTLHLRLAAAVAASLLAAGLAAYPIFTAGRLAPLLGALAAAGLLCVLLALLARGWFTGAALFTLAIENAAAEATGDVPAGSVIGYAAGHLLTLVAIAAAAAVLAVAVLAAASLRLPGALEATLLGTAAAVSLLALPWLLLRKSNNFMARGQSTGRRDSGPAECGAAGPDSGLPQRSRFTASGSRLRR
jgi:hypothetical protein